MKDKARDYMIVVLIVSTLSCTGRDGTQESDAYSSQSPEPPVECVSAWSSEAASNLVDVLVAATAPGEPVWAQYGLEHGSYVVYAGESIEGGSCLGIWQGGEIKGYGIFSVKPKLLTPLFGYFHPWQGKDGAALEPQPPEIKEWFAEIGLETAVIVPVRVEGFPFELSPFQLVQVALHEAFHVEVQMPRWFGSTGAWPVWDQQPDRAALKACYSGDVSIESVFKDERDALVDLISALLDGDRASACNSGEQFLSRRSARYELLGEAHVNDHEGVPGTCEMAEDIMELEEGTADFASWSWLYHLGQTSRSRLLGRYQAQQDERFYQTGAMQLHALMLMDPDGFLQMTEEIALSRTPQEGSPAAVFARKFESFCR